MAIEYHAGQIEVQTEANTRQVADALANWVGPVVEFCRTADMLILALPQGETDLRFMAVSGAAPLIEIIGQGEALIRLEETQKLQAPIESECGGLAISLSTARRARLNGWALPSADGLILRPYEAFTNCRKYIAPFDALDAAQRVGPASRTALAPDDPWLAQVLASAETAFLGSTSPEGVIDVSHRGGPAGFLRYDAAAASLEWDEYVGDGMFKSAGNVRATGRLTLLVPEMTTGDAVEVHVRADYRTVHREKQPRTSGLQQHAEPFPVQGHMVCSVREVFRLEKTIQPQRRLERRRRVTSSSPVEEQAPQ